MGEIMTKIGVIGGSGLYDIEGIKIEKKLAIKTPFGDASEEFTIGILGGKEVVFLPRHDSAHATNPSMINYRANIYGMKQLGVDRIISVSACGSLKKELKPLDFVVPMQFVDRTNQARKHTFFDDGVTVHIAFAYPVCSELANIVAGAARESNVTLHFGGTYLNMEGPQFSTQAESNLYRSWGMDIIGMTNMAEARLAREAEICYMTLAAVTDYDCWHETETQVSMDTIIDNLNKNIGNAKKILKRALLSINDDRKCSCKDALKDAIVTNPKLIKKDVKERLNLLIGKYVK